MHLNFCFLQTKVAFTASRHLEMAFFLGEGGSFTIQTTAITFFLYIMLFRAYNKMTFREDFIFKIL